MPAMAHKIRAKDLVDTLGEQEAKAFWKNCIPIWDKKEVQPPSVSSHYYKRFCSAWYWPADRLLKTDV